jgi:hypothetical protein
VKGLSEQAREREREQREERKYVGNKGRGDGFI